MASTKWQQQPGQPCSWWQPASPCPPCYHTCVQCGASCNLEWKCSSARPSTPSLGAVFCEHKGLLVLRICAPFVYPACCARARLSAHHPCIISYGSLLFAMATSAPLRGHAGRRMHRMCAIHECHVCHAPHVCHARGRTGRRMHRMCAMHEYHAWRYVNCGPWDVLPM